MAAYKDEFTVNDRVCAAIAGERCELRLAKPETDPG
jgi:hypothetical protein